MLAVGSLCTVSFSIHSCCDMIKSCFCRLRLVATERYGDDYYSFRKRADAFVFVFMIC